MAMTGKPLSLLAERVGGDISGGFGDPMIGDVTHDSRAVAPGSLFVALRGENFDGHQFAPTAVEAGAVAVCVDHGLDLAVPQLVVGDTRSALGPVAAAAHDDPSHSLSVIGVTGTNGKTTVTHFVESIARFAGIAAGLIGTIHNLIRGEEMASERTTPEASDWQRLLAEMRDRGCDLVAAEVSSHALALERVAATRFSVAAFTNLSQDHLDFHGNMDTYRAAKARLFAEHEVGMAVINIDDPAGQRIAGDYDGEIVTVGSGGDIRVTGIVPHLTASEFELDTPWGTSRVMAQVVGSFNVENASIAAGCCLAEGIAFEDVIGALEQLPGVPGRYEVVSGDDPVRVIVDYAHTPDGIIEAIHAARQAAPGRLIALVGAGGDRDREKRPMMGEAVSRADVAYITSDNPRSEDPSAIAAEVLSGVDPASSVVVEIDRRLAIHSAVAGAEPGDIVLILGRGHEPNQEIAGGKRPFDDRQVAREALADIRRSRPSANGGGSMAT